LIPLVKKIIPLAKKIEGRNRSSLGDLDSHLESPLISLAKKIEKKNIREPNKNETIVNIQENDISNLKP